MIDSLKQNLLGEEISSENLNDSQRLISVPLKNNFKTAITGGITVPEFSQAGTYTGNSSVFFNAKVAFANMKTLYFTMGHELLHVSQISVLAGSPAVSQAVRNIMEWGGYQYEAFLGRHTTSSFLNNSELIKLMTDQSALFNRLHFFNFPWIFAKYKYIWP